MDKPQSTPTPTPRDLRRFDPTETGLFLSTGWLKALSIIGPAMVALAGFTLWLANKPDRAEVRSEVQQVKAEISALRDEMRKDMAEIRRDIHSLLRRKQP